MNYFRMNIVILTLLMSTSVFSATEDDLKIIEIGAWAQGNSIFYLRLDRTIGPDECKSDLVKVYLGTDSDSENKLKSKSLIRSLAITALTAKLSVRVNVLDECLHNNPTIDQLYIKN